jgi:hypothetical protein
MHFASHSGVTAKRKVLAIPLFRDRISPRCEYANRMLVLQMLGRNEVSRSFLNLAKLNPLQKMNLIINQDINEIVCTGISGFWKRMLDANQIRIIQTSSFDLDEVLGNIADGVVLDQQRRLGKGRKRRTGRRG